MITPVEALRNMKTMNMEEFINAVQNLTVRYWVKEINEDGQCDYARITNAIHLGDSKWLIGLSPYKGEIQDSKYDSIYFYNLDDIEIGYVNMDQE